MKNNLKNPCVCVRVLLYLIKIRIMNVMKTNVSIKFNSIEEYREIEKVLEGLGYMNDKVWNEEQIKEYVNFKDLQHRVYVYKSLSFNIYVIDLSEKVYNSLKEFLDD